jgi:hypothetical protein
MVQRNASAHWNGLAGEKFVNVLELNLELRKVQHALFLTHLGNFTGRYEELNTVKKIDELNFL